MSTEQGQHPSHEEKLPWDQPHHLRQGSHGYRVRPAGGEEASELRQGGHRAGLGGEEGDTYALARGSGQASGAGFASGSSLSFFPSGARGALDTSGALERGRDEKRARSEGLTGGPLPSSRGSPGADGLSCGGRAGGLTGSPLAPVSPLLPGAPGSPCGREKKVSREVGGGLVRILTLLRRGHAGWSRRAGGHK